MKKFRGMILVGLLGIILSACSDKEDQLTRIDVQKVNEEGNYEDIQIIADKEKINFVEKSLDNVRWEPQTEVNLLKKEDALVTAFYTYDENMPERLNEYKIWFEENDTVTIISNKEDEGYGRLDKENAQNLQNILFN
ncbi:hypothetical protein [Lysinibacillus pakistanensis]|uniref:Lipoprotein n=1 Tax=Lysinibacillus pakistanensis TaxID=759811 RepID=A0AAX3X1E1_9BACI|nr:hypothetical protein [Lysinibacillus pakistanensis]MDM5233554.1 hypothetical protein [Lysinibacillus pakistanensis]WHY49023.1 hypothetical protein QNH22_12605 [Lysinibacillus pakistanensis]WHY54035.1 hypothetical protein QNH24_12585 [Lysinibacillus pakistanensis]